MKYIPRSKQALKQFLLDENKGLSKRKDPRTTIVDLVGSKCLSTY